MELKNTKTAVAVVWVLATFVIAFAVDVQSAAGWAVLASVALLPPFVMLRFWNVPPQTMSERIQEGRR